jgi:hypothetical protein
MVCLTRRLLTYLISSLRPVSAELGFCAREVLLYVGKVNLCGRGSAVRQGRLRVNRRKGRAWRTISSIPPGDYMINQPL